MQLPLARVLVDYPNLYLTGEARAGSNKTIARGANMVAAEFVGAADGLGDGDRGVGGVVDMNC